MSKGSKIIHVRVSDEMESAVLHAMAMQNDSSLFTPQDFSSWVRDAIQRRLNDITRKREKRKAKRSGLDAAGLAVVGSSAATRPADDALQSPPD